MINNVGLIVKSVFLDHYDQIYVAYIRRSWRVLEDSASGQA